MMVSNEQYLIIIGTQNHTLDKNESLCHLVINYSFASAPSCSLGTLVQLPLEIFNMVLLHVEVYSLMTNFGYVNRRARQIVSLIHVYSKTRLRSPVTIRASAASALELRFPCKHSGTSSIRLSARLAVTLANTCT